MPVNIQYSLLGLVFSLLSIIAVTGCFSNGSDSPEGTNSVSPPASQLTEQEAIAVDSPTANPQTPIVSPISTIESPKVEEKVIQGSRIGWGEVTNFNEVPCVTLKESTRSTIGTAPPVTGVTDQPNRSHNKDGDLTHELSKQLIGRSLNWITESQIGWDSSDTTGRLSRLQELSIRLSAYCSSFRLIPSSEELDTEFLEEIGKLLQESSDRVTRIADSELLLNDSLEAELSDLSSKFNVLQSRLGSNTTDDEYFVYDTAIGVQIKAPIDWLPVRDDSIFSISFGFEKQEPIGAVTELSGWRAGVGLRVSNFSVPESTEQDRLELIRTSMAKRWGSPQSASEVDSGSISFHVILSKSNSGWRTLSSSTFASGKLWILDFVCGSVHFDECESIMHRTLRGVSFDDPH